MKNKITKIILSYLILISSSSTNALAQISSKIHASYTVLPESISFLELDVLSTEPAQIGASGYSDLFATFGVDAVYFQSGTAIPGIGTYNNWTNTACGSIPLFNIIMPPMNDLPNQGLINFTWDVSLNQIDNITLNEEDDKWAHYLSQDLETGNFYGIKQSANEWNPEGVLYLYDSELNEAEELVSLGQLKPIGLDSYDSFTDILYLMKEYEIDDVDNYTIQFFDLNNLEIVDSIEIEAVKLAPNSVVHSMITDDFWGVRWELGESSMSEYWVHINEDGEVTDLVQLPYMQENWTLVEACVLDQTHLIASLLYRKSNSNLQESKLVTLDATTGEVLSIHELPYWLYGLRANNSDFAAANFEVVIPGCTNDEACNFNPLANEEDLSCVLIGDSCDDGYSDTFDDVIQEDCTCTGVVGIQETNQEATFNISPNPTQGAFSLVVPESTSLPINLYVINKLGQQVFETTISQQKIQINLNQLCPGIYFLTGSDLKSQKIVIQR